MTAPLTTAPVATAVLAPAVPSTPAPAPAATPAFERLGVLPWDDGATTDGHDPRSAYVETFWLPLLGPSTTLLMRRLAEEFESSAQGFEVDCLTLSREIGLGSRLTRRAPFVRTVERCVKFNLAELQGDVLHVRRQIPSLSRRQVTKLSARLAQLHEQWDLEPVAEGTDRRTLMVRATHIARTLLALGEEPHTVEQQLHRWHFHPSIAWHAVQWAQSDDLSAM